MTSSTISTAVTAPDTASAAARPGRAARVVGYVLSALVVLFLAWDAAMKLLRVPMVVEATVGMGFPAWAVPVIGGLLACCVLLYVIPRTAIFGAVLTTAYLGGAVCENLRLELDLFGNTLFPVYVAVLLWLGLYLRSAALRRMVAAGS